LENLFFSGTFSSDFSDFDSKPRIVVFLISFLTSFTFTFSIFFAFSAFSGIVFVFSGIALTGDGEAYLKDILRFTTF